MFPNAEEEVHTQLKEMLSNGIVRPSCSPWAARVKRKINPCGLLSIIGG